MKYLMVAMLIAVPGLSGAQAVLDFPGDFAFRTDSVEAAAERTYRKRLQLLAADGRLDVDEMLLGRIRRLVGGLSAAAQFEQPGAAAIHWEIHTCRRCGENASAMSGGRLLIGEEFIFGLALADDELAYLLAHEMAHVLAEHTREFASAARYFLDNGRNRRYEDLQRELDDSLVASLRMSDLYTRQEFEADYIGLILGARSGHEPEAMLRMLRKLHVESAGAFTMTMHPGNDERMLRGQAMLQTAYRIREIGIPSR